MGLDISFGTVWGIEIYYDLLLQEGIRELAEYKYDRDTGEKYSIFYNALIFRFKKDFLSYKEGDEITLENFETFLYHNFQKIVWDFKKEGIEILFSSMFIGVKSFVGTVPMERPQDLCFPLELEVEVAKEKWDKLFPSLPGKHLMFCSASY